MGKSSDLGLHSSSQFYKSLPRAIFAKLYWYRVYFTVCLVNAQGSGLPQGCSSRQRIDGRAIGWAKTADTDLVCEPALSVICPTVLPALAPAA